MESRKVKTKKKRLKIILKFLVFIMLTIGLMLFLFRAPVFVIKAVEVENNTNITKDEVILLSEAKGKNIFLISEKDIRDKIKVNPYVSDIDISRKLPDIIKISISEKKICGMVKYKTGYIEVDSNGDMVQIVNKFPDGTKPLIDGITVNVYNSGDAIYKSDSIKQEALKNILGVANYKECSKLFYSVNVTDPYNITLVTNKKMMIKIGDWTNLDYKMGYINTILKNDAIKGQNGYIELQQDGSAIFKKN